MLEWLRGFYYVARKGNIKNAARVMGRQQLTISRQIKCIEKELGITLFDQSLGKMVLTPEGKIVLDKYISIFEDIKSIRHESREKNLEYHGKFVISASHTVIDSFLPTYIVNFTKAHPLVSFHLDEALFEVVIEKVDSGEADLGIGYMGILPATIVPYELFTTKTVLIAPKNHSFFTGENPTLEQISQCPLILFSHSGAIEPYIRDRFAKEQLKLNVILTQNSISSAKKYVELGMGAAITGNNVISKEDEKSFQVIPLDTYFQDRTYFLFLRRRKYRSQALKAFIRTIKPDIPI